MDRFEQMVAAARVMASQEARAYRVFEIRGSTEEAQAFVLQRIKEGGAYCALAEEKLEEGKAKVREVMGTDALDFVDKFRATPPEWN